MDTRNKLRSGFTLMELLVVVGIVAVIAAILFPVFATVRERGRRTVCQSNLKQIAIAMQQYVQDNGGTYPPLPSDWAYAPYSYLKNVNVFRCPDHAANEILDQFGVDPPVILSDHSIWEGTTYPVDYTYNMPRLSVPQPPFPTEIVYGAHEASLATPATLWFNVDTGWTDNDGDHYVRTISTSCGREFIGRTLHSGAANYSYVDGHVKWLTPEEAGLPLGLNNLGQIVGTAGFDEFDNIGQIVAQSEIEVYETYHERVGKIKGKEANGVVKAQAVLWQNSKVYSLNQLIDAASPWYLETANGINDLGQIVGRGEINKMEHAFLLTPITQ